MRLTATFVALAICSACSQDSSAPDAWAFAEPLGDAHRPDAANVLDVADDVPTAEPTHPEWMVGLWMIDQPYHALYEVSWYEFRDDGELRELRSESFGHEIPTGRLARCLAWSPRDDDHCAEFDAADACVRYYDPYCVQWGEECTFGGAWWSSAEGEVSIRIDCSDGLARDATFDVRALLEGTAEAPTVVSVGGEPGWLHNTFEWRWLKCVDPQPAECRQFVP